MHLHTPPHARTYTHTLAGSVARCNDSNYLWSHINISLLTVWLARLVEGCKSQRKSDVVIRTKLHTLGLFPPVSREAVKGCVRKSGRVREGGTFREKGTKEVWLQAGGGEKQHTCLTFRLVLLHKYFSWWWGLKGATKFIWDTLITKFGDTTGAFRSVLQNRSWLLQCWWRIWNLYSCCNSIYHFDSLFYQK